MEEAEPEKQLRMVTGSSTQRKPFSNLTNLIHQPHPHQFKKTTLSAAAAISDSSTGFTQNRNRLKHRSIVPEDQHSLPNPRTPTSDDWIGDGNHIAYSRRSTMLKTKNKIKATDVQMPLSEFQDKGSSRHPLLRIRSNSNEVDGAEDALQSKSPTDPLPNNKRRYSSKRSSKEFVLPQDFIDQQRAYFKEVDEYELEVEEVSV